MDNIVVAAKSAETTSEIAWGNIKLLDTSLVKLPVDPSDVASAARSGDNLIVTLKTGEQVTIGDFFKVDTLGQQSELVFEGQDGFLWQADYGEPFTGFTFSEASTLDELLLAGAAASSATPGWMLAAFSLLGAGATTAAVSGGGGGGGGGDAAPPVPPTDTTAPTAPTGLAFAADGSSVSGSAETNATVIIRDAQGNVVGTAAVDADGSFQVVFPAPQANGESLEVIVTDGAGNSSDPVVITAPDITAPAAPGALALAADGSTLTGTGEPGATVTVTNAAGVVLGSALVAADGTFSLTLNPPQTNGETLSATQADASGNTSPATALIAADTTAPGAPGALALTADGSTLTGTGEPGATVTVTSAAGVVLGSALVAADGTFSLALDPPQINGQTLAATQTDAAGNASASTGIVAPNLSADNTAPDAPTGLAVSADGSVLTGRGEAGTIVNVTDAAGSLIATGTVDADGNFRVDLSPVQANGQGLDVTLTDASGNVSLPSTIAAPDIEAPAAPSNLSIDGAGLVLSGRAEAGATVVVRDAAGNLLGTGVANVDGTFQITLNSAQVDGETLTVVATDAAGNPSLPGQLEVPDLTVSAPITDLVISADGFSCGGRGEPGDMVTITNAAGEAVGSAMVNSFGRFFIRFALRLTPNEPITATQTDEDGNVTSTLSMLVPDDAGPGTPDNLSLSQDGLTLTGTGSAGDTVRVSNSQGIVLGSAIVDADGTFSITLSQAQTNGETLTLIATDLANESSVPVPFIAPDSTAPAAVGDPVVNADGTALSGTGEPGATVTVRDAQGNVVGTGTVDQAGNFVVGLAPAQADGQVLGVIQTDAAGNLSASVQATAPDITAGADLSEVAISADGSVISGRGQPGNTITVTGPGAVVLATGTVAADGTFNLLLNTPQTNGQALLVGQQDAAGNASADADLTAPDLEAPAAPGNLALDASGTLLSGLAEAGTTVTVKDAAGTVLGTALVAANGTFQITLSAAQANGQALTLSAADAAGNTSVAVPFVAPDTTAPEALGNLLISADGVTLTGRGEPGARVTITNAAGVVIGTATVGANGNFSTVLAPAAVEGDVLSAVQADAAANVSTPVTIVAPDANGPGTPGNLALSADGLQLSGTGSAGDTVNVYGPQGNLLGTATVAANGAFVIALNPAQTNGETLSVVATDQAGEDSVPVEITALDSTAPDAVTGLAISNNGATVTGSGEVGATVTVRGASGAVIGTGTVATDGTFSIVLSTPQLDAQVLQVTQRDAAGNSSDAVDLTAPDLTAPTALAQLLVSNDGLTLTGRGEIGATVTVLAPNGAALGTATVGSDGLFSVALSAAQTNGQSLSVSQSDAAGNRSPVALAQAPDTDAPGAPGALALNASGTVLSGLGEAGATVRVVDANGVQLGSALVAANGTFQVTLAPAQTNGQVLEVTQTDGAGQTSVPAAITAGDSTLPDALANVALSRDGLNVTGTGESGATVTVRAANGAVLGSAVVGSDGTFSVVLSSAQVNGERLGVAQADPGNNLSPTTFVTAADVTPPAAPVGLALDASGRVLSGTGEAGSTVRITDAQGTLLGTGTVAANGAFSITLSAAQTNGQSLKAIATDAASNSSTATTLVAADTTAPVAVGNLAISPDGLTLSGTGEAGAAVAVRAANGDLVGTGTVGANGLFLVTLARPAVQSDVLSVIETDAAGNASTPVAVNGPDGTEPVAPGNLLIGLDGLNLTGTALAGNTVTVTNAQGTVLGTAVAQSNGTFTVALSPAQHNGELLSVQASDGARVSVPTLLTALDDTAPDTLADVVLSANGSTLSGTGEAGATVNVRDAQGQLVGTGTVGTDGTFSVTFVPALIDQQVLTATQTDAGGNISAGVSVTAPDFTAPAAPSALSLNAAGTVLNGLGEAGASILVRDALGATVGTGTVAADGTFQITLATAQLTGTTLQVTLTDAAGNVSPPGALPVLDVTAPGVVTGLQLNVAGTVLTGKGEAGATVNVLATDGSVVGSAVVGATGSFVVNLIPAQANGERLEVWQADGAGNVSLPVELIAADVTAPIALNDVAISANGAVVTGLGEAGATVRVLTASGSELGTATVGADGRFSINLATPQINLQLLTVTQADVAGNLSANVNLNAPDLQAPSAPTDVALTAQGSAVTGQAEPGTVVSVVVSDAQGNVLGTATVAANGTFQVNLNTPQTNGQTLLVTSTDAAGNVSTSTTVIAADLTAPNAATELAVNPAGTLLAGKGEIGATVTVYDAQGVQVGTGTVGATGSFLVNLTPVAQNAVLSVTLSDRFDNVSLPATVTAPDANGPDQPTALVLSVDGLNLSGLANIGNTITVRGPGGVLGTTTVNPDGTFLLTLSVAQTNGELLDVVASSDGFNSLPGQLTALDSTAPVLSDVAISNDGSVITGRGEAGATVTVLDPAGVAIATATVGVTGQFSIQLAAAQIDAQLLQINQVDGAGNSSLPVTVAAPDLTLPEGVLQPLVSADGLVVTGRGETGATVIVFGGDGLALGSAVVGVDGSFSVNLNQAQSNGQTLTLLQRDPAGNESPVVSVLAGDTSIPLAPGALILDSAGLLLTGTGEAGASVQVANANGDVVGRGVVGANGRFQITLDSPQVAGQLLAVTQSDAAGNTSPPAPLAAPDTTPPTALLNVLLSSDGRVVTGTGEAGATVTVRDAAGLSLGSAVVGTDGNFSVTLSGAQINGQALSLVQVDVASNPSPIFSLQATDITAPAAPGAVSLNLAGTLLSGVTQAGAAVSITGALGEVVGSGVAGSDGSFSITLSPAQANGQSLKVTATDGAGNTSLPATVLAADITPPAAVGNLVVSADGTLLSGTGEANASLRITAANGDLLGTGTVNAAGTFLITLNRPATLSDVLTVIETDAAGNPSLPAQINGPDGGAPIAPANLLLTLEGAILTGTGSAGAIIRVSSATGVLLGTGTVNALGTFSILLDAPQRNGELLSVQASDAIGRVSIPVPLTAGDTSAPDVLANVVLSANGALVTGTGEAGAQVTVRNASNQTLGTATVGTDGAFTVNLVPAQINLQVLTVTQADTAGNLSLGVTLNAPDLTAPDAPLALVLNDVGTVLTGTGEAGASVVVRNALGLEIGTGTVAANGTFQVIFNSPQVDGGTLQVTLSDATGNLSLAGSVTGRDTLAPGAVLTPVIDADGSLITGRGEAGATITATSVDGSILGSAIVAANGTFSLALNPAQANGQRLDVLQIDAAGNISVPVTVAAPDITAPTALSEVVISGDGLVVTGRGEAGATVRVLFGTTRLGVARVNAEGQFAMTLDSPQVNLQLLTVTQVDAAGNASANVSLSAPDLQAPAAPTDVVLTPLGGAVIGKAEPGSVVSVVVSDAQGNVLGSATVAANGTFQVNLATPQTNGQTLLVTSTDAAGNTSTSITVVAGDLTAPDAPTALLVSLDGLTVVGQGEIAATVNVRAADGTLLGTGTVGPNGTFSVTLDRAATENEVLSVTLADVATNVSTAATVVAPDVNGPDQPTALVLSSDGLSLTGQGDVGNTVTVRSVTGVVLGTAVVDASGNFQVGLNAAQTNGEVLEVIATSGALVSLPAQIIAEDETPPDAVTNLLVSLDGTQVSGRGEAGAIVTIRGPDNAELGTTTVGVTGAFTVTLATAQTNGQLLSAIQVDGGSNPSPAATVTARDSTLPDAPAAALNPGGTVVTGTAEAGTVVTVIVSDALGNVLGTTTVAPDGSYQVDLGSAQANGQTLLVTSTDAAGNVSATTTIQAPDTTPPAAVTNLVISPDGDLLAGRGEVGADVTVRDANGNSIGTGVVGATGSFTVTLDNPVAVGAVLTVTQADAARNPSPPVNITAPDGTGPDQPSALVLRADGLQLTGLADAGNTVTVRSATGVVLGTATADIDGTFTVDLTVAQLNGEVLEVVATLGAQASIPAQVSAGDSTAPGALTDLVASADGTQLSGRGEAGATVTVTAADGTVLGSVIVGVTGAFTVPFTVAQLNGGDLLVVQTDANGNASPTALVPAIDSTPPLAPTATVNPGGGAVVGIAEPGTVVTVIVSDAQGNVLGTATVAPNGSYQVNLDAAQTNGQTLLVSSTDAAGNVSSTTIIVAPDTTVPDPVTELVVSADGALLTGKGEIGARVTVLGTGGASLGTAIVDANGNFTVALNSISGDRAVLTVTQADLAGNVSTPALVATPDTNGPDVPTALVLATDGLQLAGQGDIGNVITVRNLQGSVLGTSTVNTDGTFQVQLSAAQLNGEVLQVTASDGPLTSLPAQVVATDVSAPTNLSDLSVSLDGTVMTGRGEAGATVVITGPGNVTLGTGVVAVTGVFTVNLATPQINGQSLSVIQTDSAGNASLPVVALAGDRTPPAAPADLAVINQGLVLTGTGEPGAVATVTNAQNTVLGTATVLLDGSFRVVLSQAQVNGQALGVTLTDAAGNVSIPGPVVAGDTTAPVLLSNIAISNDGALTSLLTGRGEPGAVVVVTRVDGTVLGDGTVSAAGNFSVTLTPAVVTGEPLNLVQRDAAGNVSPTATINSPDTTAPEVLTQVAINLTTGATVTGLGEAGATVTVRDAAGIVLGTSQVAADNSFVITLSPAQINNQPLTVAQTDAFGNVGASTPIFAPDLTPPDVPTQLLLSAGGTVLSGVGEANAIVRVTNAAGTALGTATTVGADGTFQVTLPAQLNGQSLVVTVTDAAGNVSGPGSLLAADLTAPAAPTIIALDATGTVLTGSGEAGALLVISNNLNASVGTGTVNADGTYSVILSVPQINGEVLSVRQVDLAGNASAAATVTAGDIQAPAALVNLAVSTSGLQLTGSGEALARIVVNNVLGVQIGAATADVDGNFTVSLATPQLNGEVLVVTQADVAGNVSPPFNFPVPDTTSPLALTLIDVSADGRIVTGRGEAGATVTVTGPLNATLGTAVVAADGTFNVSLSTPQTNLEALLLVQRDAAGNVSAGVTVNAPDLTPPALPTGLGLSADGLLFNGTAEAGARIFVTSAQGTALGNIVVGADGTFRLPLSLAQLNGGTLEVYAEDAAGNKSALARLTVPDITAPNLATQLAVNADGTLLTGKGEAGATVSVGLVVGQTPIVLGTALVDVNGNFSVPLVPAVLGGQLLTVIQTDAAGNPSLGASLNIPLELPPAPPVVGTISSNGVTLTGTAEAGTTVVVRDAAGTVLGTAVTSGTTFTVTLDPPQANGQVLELHATQGALTSVATFYTSVDSTAPVPISDLAVNGIGTVVTGRGEVGATVRISNAEGVVVGTGLVGLNGTFAVLLPVAQANGGTLSAVQVDAASNTSTPVTVAAPDIIAPIAPAITGLSNAGRTLDGTGETGATATVYNATGAVIGSTTVLANGTFAVTLNSPQLNGQLLSVKLTDAAGNVSLGTPFLALDTTAPTALANVALATSGALVTGQGETGARVSVSAGGVTLGSAVVDASGNFSVNLSAAQLNGQQLAVVQTDAAGLSSPTTALTARDTTAPNAPTTLLLVGGLSLSGVGEANTTVKVYGANNVLLGEGPVNALGLFSVTLASPQLSGGALRVTLTDAAGNVSAAAQLGVADTTPPAAPTATISASGTVVSGTGEAGSTVTVRSGSTVLGTAVVAANGSYSVTLNAAQINSQVLTVSQADAAANVSPTVTTTAPDLTPPSLATGLVVAGDGLTLRGTGEPGATVSVKAANGVELNLAPVTVAADGTFTVGLSAAQINGERLSVTLTDARGNVSPGAQVVAPDIDVNEPVTASNNLATATVNITPVTVVSEYTNTSVTLLLGQIKAFAFTVAPGTVSDPLITVTNTSLLGVLPGSAFALEVQDAAGNWVTLATNNSNPQLLELLTISPNQVQADIGTLQAGNYRLTVASGLVSLLDSLTTQIQFSTTSLTQFVGTPTPLEGNVISDPGVNGLADRTGPDNGAVLQVLKNGTYVTAGAGTMVQGLYGQLTIDATGKYTYTPNGSVASVGKVEDFQYQLVHPNGLSSTAHLYVRIDSANVTEVWNPNNLAANATLVDANNDSAASALTLVNQFSDNTATIGSYNSGLLGGRGEFGFTVAPNTSTDLTLMVTGSGLSLLSPVNFVLSKLQANGTYVQVGSYSGGNLVAIGSAGLGVRVEDQTAGTYRLTIVNGGLGVASSYTASVRQEATSTNTFVVGSATTAVGNLLSGVGADVLGSPYTSLSVLSAGAFVLPGVNGVTIAGAHGSLLVNADGSYAYTPTLNQGSAVVGQTDVFTYQLNHPTGATDTATLTINLNNAATQTSFARVASLDSTDGSDQALAASSEQDDQQGTSGDDVLEGAQGGSLTLLGQEGNDTIVIYDQSFASVDGGAGTDTLKWNGGDADIDLSDLAARINNIEVIDLNQSSKVNLTLSLSDLLSVTDASTDKLLILGDTQDTVHMTGATWAPGAMQTDNGVQYNVYTPQEDPSHHLWVQSGISVV